MLIGRSEGCATSVDCWWSSSGSNFKVLPRIVSRAQLSVNAIGEKTSVILVDTKTK